MFACLNRATEILHHHLLAIADAHDRHAQIIHGARRARGSFAHHRIWPARENHRLGVEFRQKRGIDILIGVNFAIHILLAQAAGNQLRHLAAEINDQKPLMGLGNGFYRHVLRIGEALRARKSANVAFPSQMAQIAIAPIVSQDKSGNTPAPQFLRD